ncbi:MAG TPA: biopolymer transporter ExbD [Treponemataceae bacterium]|jgi:biopolymer transport protein ExbD|nr:biopolymer transporter ExbD [Treponemataceae bacterium]
MFSLKKERKKPVIATASMSDIGFLLLIFIMLISLMNQKYEEKIEYTEAKQIEKTEAEENLEIWIRRDGAISIEGDYISLEYLEALIAASVTQDPMVRIHIIADRNTPYKYVDQAVKILQKLQHRVVSFVVREEL